MSEPTAAAQPAATSSPPPTAVHTLVHDLQELARLREEAARLRFACLSWVEGAPSPQLVRFESAVELLNHVRKLAAVPDQEKTWVCCFKGEPLPILGRPPRQYLLMPDQVRHPLFEEQEAVASLVACLTEEPKRLDALPKDGTS